MKPGLDVLQKRQKRCKGGMHAKEQEAVKSREISDYPPDLALPSLKVSAHFLRSLVAAPCSCIHVPAAAQLIQVYPQ